jgi:hypothetical protein
MSLMKIVIPAFIPTADFVVCTISAYCTPGYGKTEKRACSYCHQRVTVINGQCAVDHKQRGRRKKHDCKQKLQTT